MHVIVFVPRTLGICVQSVHSYIWHLDKVMTNCETRFTLSVNVMKEMHMTQNDQMKSDKLKLSSIGKNCQVIRHLLAPALSGGVYIITDHKNRRVLLMSASNYL